MVPRLLVVLLAALAATPAAHAQPAPQNLRAFLLTANEPEPAGRTFARTPSFAWSQVPGATRYHFQLSTSQRFADNGIVWETRSLASPLATVPITLPWMTGSQYNFYARVRAVVGRSTTRWSAPYGFRLRAPAPPASLSSGLNLARPGMIRWTPVEGATSYEVLFLYSLDGVKKTIKTATTAADLREIYTLHSDVAEDLDVVWRVRAVREVIGHTANRVPVASHTAWSGYNLTTEVGLTSGTIAPLGAVSRSRTNDVASGIPGPGPAPHELVPAFWWSGDRSLLGLGACPAAFADLDITCPLYRLYVYTDEDCANRVHTSDLVGSPAYVPRLTMPLAVPSSREGLDEMYVPGTDGEPGTYLILQDGDEGKSVDAGGDEVFAAGTDPDLPPPAVQPKAGKKADRRSGIWDNDWSDSRYYWTVVPVVPHTPAGSETVEWHDVEFGQDMCEAGRVGTFGKTSAPAIGKASGVPFVSGLASTGRVRGAATDRPSFWGRVVVAWRPAPGAFRYRIQWSRTAYPFSPAGGVTTPATSALLDLPTGVWYYRVRGLDHSIPGPAQGMTWSDPQYLKIEPRRFVVVPRPR